MNTRSPAKPFASVQKAALVFTLLAIALNVTAATTDLAPAPLVTSPTASVLPNIFLMMDDSGSMAWEYMPDNAGNFNAGTYGAASYQCNGISYNPAITYAPPVDSTGGSFAASSFTAAPVDGFGTTSTSTVNLSTSFVDAGGDTAQAAFYYKYTGTQTTEKLKDYYNTGSTFYTECSGSASSNAISATINVGGSGSTSVSSITVNGVTITSGGTSASTTKSTVASRIASAITATGYTATASGSTVTITGPLASVGFTPVVNSSGTMTFTRTAFTSAPFTKVVISSATATYPKAATRTDCAASTTCTFAEESQNFANWYSFYRTRILMMKTATGLAFKTIGNTFRVGMATMNNNSGTDFLGLATFDATQKANWYTKLYATRANNSTPLREALSNVGRMYAMKLPGNTLNAATVVDPIQYSCQQNFAILTTDGFWNGPTDYNLSGGTVGNQDGTEVRPMYDGANQTSQSATTTNIVTHKSSVQGTTTNTIWTRNNVTSVSATKNCGGGTGGYDITGEACRADNGQNSAGSSRTWCVGNAINGTSGTSQCTNIGATSGSISLQVCRGISNATNLPSFAPTGSWISGTGCDVDKNGVTWCVYYNSNHAGGSTIPTGATACSAVLGSNDVSICTAPLLPAAPTGYTVITQPQSYTQTVVGTTTTLTDYPSTSTSTVTTTNGVVSTPVITTTTGTPIVISTSTAATSDTGIPGAGTTWANTGGSVSSCQATQPALGASAATAGTPTITNQGAATVTTPSTTTTINPTVTTASSSGGTFDTLADVAEYYYTTDLRTAALGNNLSGAAGAVNGTDISGNNVPSSGADSASHQHMTTFTLGLGARGRMVFDPTYQTSPTGDFYAVKQGSTASTASGVCTWQADNTTCNWPTPASNAIENIDDLWHTAVNGRGTYFSAANPSDLSLGLTSALAGVSARLGSSAAATTSTAFITQGDNFLFRSSYVSMQWTGELIRQQLDVNTGAVLPTIDWSAQTKLDAQTTRNIYFFNSAASTQLTSFLWANLNATQQSYFNLAKVQLLTQSCASGATCLTTANQTLAAGANLVNFIRGDRTNEGALADNSKYYRQRQHILGDIVDSESVYVKGGLASFTDSGYSAFKSSTMVTSRNAMVYVGANDGMLHAFRAADDPATTTVNEGGQEDWAFIPSMVMPNLYKLADKGYDLRHQFYVDGSPVAADICFRNCATAGASDWKTILVGGLNFGGMGYYALDVTDPANPKALWEFTNPNLGYSYGNPKVVKLKDGTWVVIVSSGYNNVPPDAASGDGLGHLYILNANTGAILHDITTGVGSATTPSGLARIDVPVTSPGIDATGLAAYGGDLLGNLWRFDINGPDSSGSGRWTDIGSAGFDAQLLATLRGPGGNVQPITAKPLITLVDTVLVVNVGTGRYLGTVDLSDTSQQSFYAMKDTFPSGTTPSVAIYANPHSLSSFVQQTQTATTCPSGSSAAVCTAGQSVVTASNTPVNFTTQSGWYFDFPHTGERNNTDSAIMQGTLLLTTNVPNSSSCSVGGDSYLYQLNYRNGGAVSSSTTGVTAVKLGNELASRPVVASLADGTSRAYVQGSGGTTPSVSNVWQNIISSGVGRRVSWRELTP